MGEQLVAHATGNCKPCSFFFFKEQCHSTYDKWQEVYGCFGICMHLKYLNDLGWGCRTQDSTGGRVVRGGWDQKKIRRAKVRHYSHLQYLVVGIANLPYIRIIRLDASTNGFSCGSGRRMPTRKFLLILSFVQLSNITFFFVFEIPRVWLKGRP